MTTSKNEFQRSFAVIIGIDEYDDSSISNLKTAVADAQKLAEIIGTRHKELKEKYQQGNKYDVKLLTNPTKGELEELLDDFKQGKISIHPDRKEEINENDRLLFYFAGHGKAFYALDNQEGSVGYFIPRDAKNGNRESYLAMQDLYDALIKLECRHMLAILDCCCAGAFNWVRRDVKSIGKTYKERYDRFIEDPAWQVITSAAYNQEAWDSSKVRGQIKYGGKDHSPFAAALFDALLDKSAELTLDVNSDNVITASELYLYLKERVSFYTDKNSKRQTPGYCPLKKHQDGEFIFLLKDFDRDNLDDAPPLNLENNPYRGLSSYEYNKRDSELFFGREELIKQLEEKINFEERKPEKKVDQNPQVEELVDKAPITKSADRAIGENNQSSRVDNGLTVVLGASGTGKSSLVKAGLLPRLEKGGKFKIITPMRPEENPVQSLAKVFLPIINTEAEKELKLTQELEDAKYAVKDIINTVDGAKNNNNNELLQAIDQLNLTRKQQKYFQKYSDVDSIDNNSKNLLKQWLKDYKDREEIYNKEQKRAFQFFTLAFLKGNENLRLPLLIWVIFLQKRDTPNQKEPKDSSTRKKKNEKELIQELVYAKASKKLIEELENEEDAVKNFLNLIKQWGNKQENQGKKLLLVIDQFEELITLRKGSKNKDKKQQQFQLLLKEAIEKCSDIFHVIVTLRIDFEPQFQDSPLYEFLRKEQSCFTIGPITQDEIREVIEKPAEKTAIFFESPKLVNRLVNKVVQMPGALPLLSFTLNELYLNFVDSKKDDRVISEQDYKDIGGVVGSLARSANKIYDELVKDPAYEKTIRKVMLRMVAVGGNELVRRRAFLSEFEYTDKKEYERVQRVLKKFVEARLLVKGKNSEGKSYIEPAHDYLVTGWDKLTQWKNQELDTLILQQRLKTAIDDWQEIKNQEEEKQNILLKPLSQTEFYILDKIQSRNLKRKCSKQSALLRIKILKPSVKNSKLKRKFCTFAVLRGTENFWLYLIWIMLFQKRDAPKLNTDIETPTAKKTNTKSGQYLWHNNPRLPQLSEMLVSEDKWLSRDEDRFVRHSIVKKSRNTFWARNFALLIALLMSGFGVWALKGQREAQIGEIRALRKSAEGELKSDKDLEATLNILRAKKALKGLLPFGLFPDKTEERELQAMLHQVYYETKESNRIQLNHGSVYRVALSPDNKKLATVGLRDTLTLWDTSDSSNIKLQKQFKTEQDDVWAVAFHPIDSSIFATAGLGGDIKLWQIDNGKIVPWETEDNKVKPAQLSIGNNIVHSIAFINDDKIATLETNRENNSKTIKIRDTSSGKAQKNTLEIEETRSISLVTPKDKKLLAIAAGDNKVALCPIQFTEPNTPQLCDENELEENTHSIDKKTIRSVASDQNGNLAITDEGGKIRLYPIEEKDNKISLKKTESKEIPSSEGILPYVALNEKFMATIGNNFQMVLKKRGSSQSILTQKLPAEMSRNNSVALSSDGSRIATAGEDGYVRLWDSSGKLERTIRADSKNVRSVTFIPEQTQKQLPDQNKTLILTGGDDKIVKLWDTSSGKRLSQTPPQSSKIISVVFIPNQPQQFATFHENGNYKIWEISFDNKIEEVRLPYTTKETELKEYKSAAFTPTGDEVLTLGENGKIKIWENTQESIGLLENFKPDINSFTLTPDGTQVVIGDKEGIVWLWNGRSEPTRFLSTQQGSIDALAMTPNEKLVTVGEDGTLRIWDISKKQIQLPQISRKNGFDLGSIAFSSDSTKLATVKNGNVQLWDTFGNLLKHIPTQNNNAPSVAFSSDDKFLAVAGKDGTVKILNSKGNKLNQVTIPQGVVNNLSFDNDDNLLVSKEYNKSKTEDNKSKTIVYKVKINDETSNSSNTSNPKLVLEGKPVISGKKVALSKNSDNVAYVDKTDPSKVILNGKKEFLMNGKKEFLTQQGDITSLALSDNGKLLATTGSDGTLLLENTKSGSREFDKIPTLQGNNITSVVFSPDSNLIATIGDKEENNDTKTTVKLWQITEAEKKLRPFKTFDNVSNVAFSPDGKLLATADNNGEIELHKVGEVEDLFAKVCNSVKNYLKNGQNVSKSDRNLCEGASPPIIQPKTSIGEKILVTTGKTQNKQDGVNGFAASDFTNAIEELEDHLTKNPNDPEALIYLNNAKVGTLPYYTIAVSVPISSDENGALEMLRGVAQAQNTINQGGGIDGKKLRVLIADDKNDPEVAKKIAQQFSNNPDVLGVVGHYASDTTLAASEIYKKEKLPAISPVSTSVRLSGLSKYTLRTVPSDKEAARKLAEYMRNKYPQSKAVVFYNSKSEYSESLAEEFMNYISNFTKIDLSDDNFGAAESLKELEPKTVLVLMPNVEKLDKALEVVKQNSERQPKLPMLAGDDMYSPKTLEKGQKDALDMVVAVPWDIDASQNPEFKSKSEELWRAEVNWRTAMSYDATKALVEAIERVRKNNKQPTPERIAEELGLEDFVVKGATGKVKFSDNGDRQNPNIQLVKIVSDSGSEHGYNFEPIITIAL